MIQPLHLAYDFIDIMAFVDSLDIMPSGNETFDALNNGSIRTIEPSNLDPGSYLGACGAVARLRLTERSLRLPLLIQSLFDACGKFIDKIR